MERPETLTEAEGYHYPVGVAVVKARVRQEGNGVLAEVEGDGDMARLRAIEACAVEKRAGQERTETSAGRDIRLKTHGWVECVKEQTMERQPISAIEGVTCLIQVIARPIHAWSYENEVGRRVSGMDWELDRVYIGRGSSA